MPLSKFIESSQDVGRMRSRWPGAAWGVLLLGLFITAILTVQYERIEHHSTVQQIEDNVDRMESTIEGRLRTYVTVLHGAAGMFEGSDVVTAHEFSIYIDRLQLETVYAGMEAIGFAQRVTPENRDNVVAQVRSYGWPDFDVEFDEGQEEKIIITHIQPETPRSRNAVGVAIGEETRRMEAMRNAGQSRRATATESVTLLPEKDPAEPEGFSIYVAVYDAGEIAGYVFSTFGAAELMQVVLGAYPEMSFDVFDGEEPDEDKLLYQVTSTEPDGRQRWVTAREIDVAGRPWTILFHAPMESDMWVPVLPLTGIALSLFLAGLVWNLIRARTAAADRAMEIQAHREWLAVTLGSIGDAVLATDAQGRVTFMNARAEELTGWPLDEVVGRNASEILRFEDEVTGRHIVSPVSGVLLNDVHSTVPHGTVLVRRDGTTLPVDDVGAPIRTHSGKHGDRLLGAVVTFRDITQRRRAEDALKESQVRLQFALDSAQVGEWDYDVRTGTSRRSLRHDQAFGYEQGVDHWDVHMWQRHIHPEDRDRVVERFEYCLESCDDWDDVFRVIWPDGLVHYLEVHGSVYASENGRATRVLGLVQDVTERVTTEENLRRSEQRFRTLVTATSSIIWTSNGDGQIVHEVPAWEAYTGQSVEEYSDLGWTKAIHPDDIDEVMEEWAKVNRKKEPLHIRYRLRRHDGEYRRVDVRGVPILDDDGNVHEWVGSISDIEDQQRTAEALLLSEQKFRWIIESAIDIAIFTFDRDGVIDSWNPGAERVLGFKEEDILGRNVRVLYTPEDRASGQPVKEREEAASELSALDERWHIRADGELFYAAGRVMPLKDDEGKVQGFVKIVHDRTAERRAQEELEQQTQQLQESEARFRTMADSAPVYIWMAGTDANCTWFNRPMLEFTGRTLRQEISAEWFDLVHPDERDECRRQYYGSFDERKPLKLKYRMQRHDGEYRWVLNHGVPMRGPNDTFAGYIGSCIDITELEEARVMLEEHSGELERLVEQRTASLRESHERLRLSERMASLGTLAAGIGHDLGNLLLPLRMRLDVLEEYVPEPERDSISVIRSTAEYLGNLARGLRHLATNPEKPEDGWAQTEIPTWWRETEPLLRNALPRDITLEHEFDDNLPLARISPAALTQAVFNLVQNAGNAMADTGEGTVRIWATLGESDQSNQPMVRIGVSDNGPGMDEEVKRRCLEPFFTTKTRELSTGLGLSLVQGVIQRAGGRVELESESGRGTTFVLIIPSSDSGEDKGDADQLPLAAVAVTDARLRGFVTSELKSMGFSLRSPQDVLSEEGADVRLWAMDTATDTQEYLEYLNRLAEEDHDRRIILFGEGTSLGGGLEQQVIHVPGRFKPSSVREALRQAATESARSPGKDHAQREAH